MVAVVAARGGRVRGMRQTVSDDAARVSGERASRDEIRAVRRELAARGVAPTRRGQRIIVDWARLCAPDLGDLRAPGRSAEAWHRWRLRGAGDSATPERATLYSVRDGDGRLRYYATAAAAASASQPGARVAPISRREVLVALGHPEVAVRGSPPMLPATSSPAELTAVAVTILSLLIATRRAELTCERRHASDARKRARSIRSPEAWAPDALVSLDRARLAVETGAWPDARALLTDLAVGATYAAARAWRRSLREYDPPWDPAAILLGHVDHVIRLRDERRPADVVLGMLLDVQPDTVRARINGR